MDIKGHAEVVNALEEAGVVDPRVSPIPEEGENKRYLTILADVLPEVVLNTLDDEGLMFTEGQRQRRDDYSRPQLDYLGTDGNKHTFEDISAR